MDQEYDPSELVYTEAPDHASYQDVYEWKPIEVEIHDPHNTQDPDEYHDRCVDMEVLDG